MAEDWLGKWALNLMLINAEPPFRCGEEECGK